MKSGPMRYPHLSTIVTRPASPSPKPEVSPRRAPRGVARSFTKNGKFDSFAPMFYVNLKIDEGVSAYASAAKGFRRRCLSI